MKISNENRTSTPNATASSVEAWKPRQLFELVVTEADHGAVKIQVAGVDDLLEPVDLPSITAALELFILGRTNQLKALTYGAEEQTEEQQLKNESMLADLEEGVLFRDGEAIRATHLFVPDAVDG